jgi:hypothetical protein
LEGPSGVANGFYLILNRDADLVSAAGAGVGVRLGLPGVAFLELRQRLRGVGVLVDGDAVPGEETGIALRDATNQRRRCLKVNMLGCGNVEGDAEKIRRLTGAASLLCQGRQGMGSVFVVLRQGNGAILSVLERLGVHVVTCARVLDGLLQLRLGGVRLIAKRRRLSQES